MEANTHNNEGEKECPKCGKDMEEKFDEIAKKYTGYQWYCECNPNLIISIG